MKELNLTVGKKAWSIQLGDCVVKTIVKDFGMCFKCANKDGKIASYDAYGKYQIGDFRQSLFESNPFERSVDTTGTIEPKLIRQQNDEWVENKAELINALVNLINADMSESLDNIAETKLQKLLESI